MEKGGKNGKLILLKIFPFSLSTDGNMLKHVLQGLLLAISSYAPGVFFFFFFISSSYGHKVCESGVSGGGGGRGLFVVVVVGVSTILFYTDEGKLRCVHFMNT